MTRGRAGLGGYLGGIGFGESPIHIVGSLGGREEGGGFGVRTVGMWFFHSWGRRGGGR